MFGAPELRVISKNNIIHQIKVIRGAPCGATWEASRKIIGTPVSEAPVNMGLETQFFCTADPSDWDPISGKSPVHLAAELHKAAMITALKTTKNHITHKFQPIMS